MGETRNMDGAVRVRAMNDAREKIGGEAFLSGDDKIKESFELGLCETLVVDRLDAAVGASVTFPAVLLVDGANVTADPKALASVKVTGEVLAEQKGPKIAILRYKSKTGYRRRQGYRSKLTRVKITGINK